MAYLYEGSAKTQTGTVTYKRKKHVFKSADLRRTAKSVGWPSEEKERLIWLRFLLDVLRLANAIQSGDVRILMNEAAWALAGYIASLDPHAGSGDSGFGGGGATGTWWRPLVP